MSIGAIKLGIKTFYTLAKHLPGISRVVNSANAGSANSSLIAAGRATRAEPIVLLDDTLAHQAYITDVLYSVNTIFSSYYLSVATLKLNGCAVQTIKTLESLNPSRSGAGVIDMARGARTSYMGESLSYKLTDYSHNQNKVTSHINFSTETESYQAKLLNQVAPIPGVSDVSAFSLSNESITAGRDAMTTITSAPNLSVGHTFSVTAREGTEANSPSFEIQITVRLIVSTIRPQTIVDILAYAEKNNSPKERIHLWRAGQIEFIDDLILCKDLAKEHRRTLMNDSSKVYREILARKTNNTKAGIASGTASVATSSNIVIISSRTLAQLESMIGSTLSNFKVRDRIFRTTYLMLLIVVDTDSEVATIYHDSIELPSKVWIKDMKASGAKNNKGVDVGEMIRMYQLGQAPKPF